jgi:site-specific DNA-methyltransferase (adenine-specific)
MELLHGDCREILKQLPDASVDSIVTDPPYELGFMGKSWDSTGVAYDVTVWQECLRVLKPGGHLLAFGGSRTYHRLVVAIEDAGFQIRDQIMWVYGSGFPKSLNISKAIDKSAGVEREVIGSTVSGKILRANGQNERPYQQGQDRIEHDITAPATEKAKQWDGWGTALKPSHEPIVMARKPLVGTVANNVLTHGTGGINIDGSRVAHQSEADRASATPQGKVTSNKMAGSAPDVDDAGRVDVDRPDTALGRFPANFIHDGSEEVLELLGNPARFFYSAKASKAERNAGLEDLPQRRASAMGYDRGLGDAGEGMFKDRNPQKQNFHPTVKPIALMRYLVRLVTPPNGKVLDPFAGSGTTLVAAVLEGFDCIGIEMTDEYLPIIEARVAHAKTDTLF